jgi:hypothetical protein
MPLNWSNRNIIIDNHTPINNQDKKQAMGSSDVDGTKMKTWYVPVAKLRSHWGCKCTHKKPKYFLEQCETV